MKEMDRFTSMMAEVIKIIVKDMLAREKPGLTKKVLSEKFGDKTVNVTIEIEDPDPKGIL